MSNESFKTMSTTTKGGLLLTGFVVIGALSALLVQRPGGKQHLLGPRPAAVALERSVEMPPPEANTSALDTKRAAPTVTPTLADGAATLPAKVGTFLDEAVGYYQEDRAKVVEDALAKVVAGGPASVFEIQRQLEGIAVYDQQRRAAAFHALERIGKALPPTDPRSKAAFAAMQSIAKSELELPNLVEPNPELDVESLSAVERDEFLHQGILVEHEGELMQSTALNKLPAVRLLGSLGGQAASEQLGRLAKAPDNAPGVQLAAQQALQIASR